MSVVAIKCEACQGKGRVEVYLGIRPRSIKFLCGVCNGTGTERPPVNHDLNARKHVEHEPDE